MDCPMAVEGGLSDEKVTVKNCEAYTYFPPIQTDDYGGQGHTGVL